MSWLFRIRPTPVMPMDCATPLQFWQQHAAQPTARGTCPVTRSLRHRSGRGSGAGPWLGRISRCGASPGRSRVPAKNSVGSLRGVLPRTQAPVTRAGRPGLQPGRSPPRPKLCARRWPDAVSRRCVPAESQDHVGAPDDESPARPARHTFLARTSGPVADSFNGATSHAGQRRRGRGGPKTLTTENHRPPADHAAGNAADDRAQPTCPDGRGTWCSTQLNTIRAHGIPLTVGPCVAESRRPAPALGDPPAGCTARPGTWFNGSPLPRGLRRRLTRPAGLDGGTSAGRP